MAGLSSLARVYALAAPGANTDILTTGITPQYDGVFIVTVALTTGSIFNVTSTDGSTSYTVGLNASTALNAGDAYTFCFGVRTGITYNFQVETDSAIRWLNVLHAIDAVGLNSAQGA